ncbi:Rab11 family-interacting protein 2 [Platysternon megacephalum]|uniref:Rab11 family-interacting protein 2 n=1 Tax=Platysternon megacephalum TaxID=55544 RepID=A0A4D9E130_9SAUR|nr:Rab11 family-interacting protein 2 [Platysternon megacephalum]
MAGSTHCVGSGYALPGLSRTASPAGIRLPVRGAPSCLEQAQGSLCLTDKRAPMILSIANKMDPQWRGTPWHKGSTCPLGSHVWLEVRICPGPPCLGATEGASEPLQEKARSLIAGGTDSTDGCASGLVGGMGELLSPRDILLPPLTMSWDIDGPDRSGECL